MQDFINQIEKIEDRNEFIVFVDQLVLDLKNNPDEWANKTLVEYLEAISSWTEDMDGYYRNRNASIPENIPWKVFANILTAAKMYE